MEVAMATVQVDVWSDIACPWCYVGKVRLEKAIENVKMAQPPDRPVDINITWHPYMIDPRTNPAGEEYLAYNIRRWGSDSWTQSLRRSGARNGLKFANWQWWPNTLNAHRLVHWAQQQGKGSEAKSLLLQKTYEEGRNVSDMTEIVAIAEELGLHGVQEYMASENGKREILAEDRKAKQELNVGGVPYFLLNNSLYFSGAQDVGTFEKAFQRVLA